MERGRTAVFQARLVLFVMINIAQLWILSATIEAALAGEYNHLLPLVAGSAVCWLIGAHDISLVETRFLTPYKHRLCCTEMKQSDQRFRP